MRRGLDPLRELAARYPKAAVIVDDPALAASLRADLGDRLSRVDQAFDDAIETVVAALGSPDVTLASGVRLSVYPTPALVAIDVDGGGALTGAGAATRRHLALNAAVLPELARQIRLRNLSGAILIDFAGLRARQRTALGAAFAASLADDPMRPRFLGFTALGLAEVARPRAKAPLHEALSGTACRRSGGVACHRPRLANRTGTAASLAGRARRGLGARGGYRCSGRSCADRGSGVEIGFRSIAAGSRLAC
jgi:ribonuclease G